MATPRAVDEFMELLGRHQTRLMGFIYSLVQNMDDTEDLYQQASLVMWRKYEQYETGTDFMSWACQIARFEVLNFVRQAKSQRICFSEAFLAEAAAPNETDDERAQLQQQALAACRQALPDTDQQLLTRRYGGNETVQSIAADLQRSPQSICNTLGRIRRALMTCIERKLKAEAIGG